MYFKEIRRKLFLMDTWWQLLSAALIAVAIELRSFSFTAGDKPANINNWGMFAPEDLINSFL